MNFRKIKLTKKEIVSFKKQEKELTKVINDIFEDNDLMMLIKSRDSMRDTLRKGYCFLLIEEKKKTRRKPSKSTKRGSFTKTKLKSGVVQR